MAAEKNWILSQVSVWIYLVQTYMFIYVFIIYVYFYIYFSNMCHFIRVSMMKCMNLVAYKQQKLISYRLDNPR